MSQSPVILKRTPLFSSHQELGARLVEFGGWEMPVQYTSIVEEHLAVRSAAGIFDICHMGEVGVDGLGAADFLNSVLTNDIRKLKPGLGQYTLMCNERGGVVDDLYAYQVRDNSFQLIINASRIEEDVRWLLQKLAASARSSEVDCQNRSETTGAIAVQGPRVAKFIDRCVQGATPTSLKKNEATGATFLGKAVLVARTGYTGEDGFEIVGDSNLMEPLWNKLLEVGSPFGLKPAGLGARDTLRTEVCYPLYGHELDENTTPIEAGLGYFVALDKGDFIGRSVLAEQKAKGTARKLVAFKMTGKTPPPRPHYAIWSAGPGAVKVGEVTSGTQSPSLGIGIGLGYVPTALAKPGTVIEIEIRDKRFPAVIVQKPIYRRPEPSLAGSRH